MKNYVQHGDTIGLTAPEGGVVSGAPCLIGNLFGVASHSAVEGALFELRRKGVVTFPKPSGQAWGEGAPLFFDAAAGKLTTVAGSLTPVAVCVRAAGSSALSGDAVMIPFVLGPTAAAITDAVVAVGAAPTKAEHDALVTKLNAVLAALRAAQLVTA